MTTADNKPDIVIPAATIPETQLLTATSLWQQCWSWFCARNPLYLLSALILIYAQSAIFTANPLMPQTEIPAALLAGYTVLLAASGLLIVRVGRAWDDARSVILLVLTLLLILPVGADGMILNHPAQGRLWLGGFFILGVAVSELLRRGLRLRIPALPLTLYYMLLAVFCAWPALLGHLVLRYERNTIPAACAILLFPVVIAALFLLLIPVIRRGAPLFADNGTPWTWPWFPLTAFGLLGLGAAFRTYLLTISFIGGKGAGPYSSLESGFGLWMLLPLLAVLAILTLEYAVCHRSKLAEYLTLAMPVLLLICSLCGNDSTAARTFTNVLPGNYQPVALIYLFLPLYYAWAGWRRIPYATTFFHISLGITAAIAAMISQSSWSTWFPGHALVMIFIADMIIMACRHRSSEWSFMAGSAIIFDFCLGFKHDSDDLFLVIIATAFLANFYLNGAFFRDRFAATLNSLAACLIPIYLFAIIIVSHNRDIDLWFVLAAIAGLLLLEIAGCIFITRSVYRNSLICCGLIIGITGIIEFFRWKEKIQFDLTGIGLVTVSLLTLAAAIAISLHKGRKQLAAIHKEE